MPKDSALKAAFLITTAVVIVILYSGLSPVPIALPQCPLYSLTGLHCPGCGSQRAVSRLFQGDLSGVFSAHPLFIPGVVLCTFLYLTRKRDWAWHKNNTFIYGILAVLVAFFIMRNIPRYPFTLLAPH